ncbi:hypothetical protein [Caulobacter sp.]|uniref:hypothetical protein n=1 Tax=Caulobacter sp. TaxID=78 RepID=UPI001B05A0C8|nr:hypothetical protein [Caulobacter sp.]MBO9545873.1 hypothetical protein [Caulobacter sp.]
MNGFDIQVASPHLDPAALRARVMVSRLVTAPREVDDDGAAYEDEAMTPSPAWRALEDEEAQALLTPAAAEPRFFGQVGLVNAPGAAVEALTRLADEQASRLQERSLRSSVSDIRDRLHAVVAAIPGVRPVGPMLSVSHGRGTGGLLTVTRGKDGRRIGLHVDSWDGVDLKGRRRASNRLAVNTGQAPRYFLFLPRQVANMPDKTGADSKEALDLVRAYVRLFEDDRVFRLEVRPGEAYVAPTENIIHDGSSDGAVGQDRTAMVRGYIHLDR